jgi:hypothetical protein
MRVNDEPRKNATFRHLPRRRGERAAEMGVVEVTGRIRNWDASRVKEGSLEDVERDEAQERRRCLRRPGKLRHPRGTDPAPKTFHQQGPREGKPDKCPLLSPGTTRRETVEEWLDEDLALWINQYEREAGVRRLAPVS